MDDDDGKGEGKHEDERSGNAAIWGVLFVVALTIGAIYLIERMRSSAALAECAFTHAPKCRELIEDK